MSRQDAYLPSLVERLLDWREVLPWPAGSSLEELVASVGVGQLGCSRGAFALRDGATSPATWTQLLGVCAWMSFLEIKKYIFVSLWEKHDEGESAISCLVNDYRLAHYKLGRKYN